jgi:hypothetical protein
MIYSQGLRLSGQPLRCGARCSGRTPHGQFEGKNDFRFPAGGVLFIQQRRDGGTEIHSGNADGGQPRCEPRVDSVIVETDNGETTRSWAAL